MKKIIIRVFGGTSIGYGHFYRCLSLVQAIDPHRKDFQVIFLVNQELIHVIEKNQFEFKVCNSLEEDYEIVKTLKPKLFIFDSYLGNDDYLNKIKSVSKLMLIDDNNDIYDSSIADILYNGNIHAQSLRYKKTKKQIQLIGPDYLIMKQEYWKNDMPPESEKEGILITTGGSDQYGVSVEILKSILEFGQKLRIVIGPGYKEEVIAKLEQIKYEYVEWIYKPDSLKNYIDSSKIVICAAGSTVYEVLSQETLPIIFSLADNQDKICSYLSKQGIIYIGRYPEIDYIRLQKTIMNVDEINYEYQKEIFYKPDGKGAIRAAKAILENM